MDFDFGFEEDLGRVFARSRRAPSCGGAGAFPMTRLV